ncbi:MAG: hypothetical protein JNL88_04560 [Bacteroidia bacterium]|nr:hypothetical protein [Bacteroidia bacterium]
MVSFPQSFQEKMQQLLGEEEGLRFFESQELPPPVSVRLHPLKGPNLYSSERRIPWCKEGRYLSERPLFTLEPVFHAGAYYVQEAGSMLIEVLLSKILKEIASPLVLDLCAAPGGKSTHLLSMLNGKGVLVSNELIPSRNKALRHNLAKWGYSNSIVTQNKSSEISRSALQFDILVVDAPCSGEGLFRKEAKAIQEWSPDQVAICSRRQQEILHDILPALKPGGYLLYSTCTYEETENDGQMADLIGKYGLQVCMPSEIPGGITATRYGWQAFPHKVESEGFYCCLLRKTDESADAKVFKKGSGAKPLPFAPSKDWLKDPLRFVFRTYAGRMHALLPETDEALHRLSSSCFLRAAGVPLGEVKGKDFIPAPELALSLELDREKTRPLALSRDEALRYLKCDTQLKDSPADGFHLACFETYPLGWAKKIGHRWNNYFPKEWRILMDTE